MRGGIKTTAVITPTTTTTAIARTTTTTIAEVICGQAIHLTEITRMIIETIPLHHHSKIDRIKVF